MFGIMGAAGSDAAIETADVALMGDDLGKLLDRLEPARRDALGEVLSGVRRLGIVPVPTLGLDDARV